jgi:photosystem II stability/assembly factor-like uncharacterized protein
VLSNTRYVVGAANRRAGVYYGVGKDTTWQHTGWKNIRAFDIKVVPEPNGDAIHLACGNGLLRTMNNGAYWRITTSWEVTEVLQVQLDPTNPNVIYISGAYGLWKSTDGTATWQKKVKGLKDTFVSALLVDRANPNVVFAGTETGLYRSNNGGETWSAFGGNTLKGKGIRRLVQSPLRPNVLALGTEDDGVFLSYDSGKTWKQMSDGLNHLTVYAIAFDPQDDSILYAGGFQSGVYKTTDGGKSWTQSTDGLTILNIHSLVVHLKESNIVFCGTVGKGVFRSSVGGKTWQYWGLDGAEVWNMIAVTR